MKNNKIVFLIAVAVIIFLSPGCKPTPPQPQGPTGQDVYILALRALKIQSELGSRDFDFKTDGGSFSLVRTDPETKGSRKGDEFGVEFYIEESHPAKDFTIRETHFRYRSNVWEKQTRIAQWRFLTNRTGLTQPDDAQYTESDWAVLSLAEMNELNARLKEARAVSAGEISELLEARKGESPSTYVTVFPETLSTNRIVPRPMVDNIFVPANQVSVIRVANEEEAWIKLNDTWLKEFKLPCSYELPGTKQRLESIGK